MPRGIPSEFVPCWRCGSPKGWPKSRQCRACTSLKTRKYHWTPALDLILRDAYAQGTGKHEITAAIDEAQRRVGFPRYALSIRAQQLGLTQNTRRPWTKDDLEFLEEHAGAFSVKWIAGKLKRTHESTQAQMEYRRISRRRDAEGYSKTDVAKVLGVSFDSVDRWARTKVLKLARDRVTEKEMRRFICEHPQLYRLRRVDDFLFKSILFQPHTQKSVAAKENHW